MQLDDPASARYQSPRAFPAPRSLGGIHLGLAFPSGKSSRNTLDDALAEPPVHLYFLASR